MWADIGIALGLCVLTAIMGYLGVHVTLHAQSDPKKILRFKIAFVTAALLMGCLIIVQTVRSYRQSESNGQLLAQIQKNTLQPPNVTVENKIDPSPLASLFRPEKNNNAQIPVAPRESPNSLRRRTLKLVNELNVFWSQRPEPTQQPVQNPSTDEERRRNATWDQYWRDANTAYLNANYRERLLGIVREYKSKGIPTGYMEQAIEQSNRLVGAGAFGGSALDDCSRYMNELCQLRELAYHVDAQDQPIFLAVKQQK